MRVNYQLEEILEETIFDSKTVFSFFFKKSTSILEHSSVLWSLKPKVNQPPTIYANRCIMGSATPFITHGSFLYDVVNQELGKYLISPYTDFLGKSTGSMITLISKD